MRSYALPLMVIGLMGAGAASVRADQTAPHAVVSLASYDSARVDPYEIGFVQDADELPAWLSSMVQLYAEGKDVAGLDHSRPWGAVIRYGEKAASFGFVPVTDVDRLKDELGGYIRSTSEVSPGIYKVVGTEAGKQLFARESGGWLFVSDSADSLDMVPSDPAALLGGLDKSYAAAVRLSLKNLPEPMGKQVLSQVGPVLGLIFDKSLSQETKKIVAKAASALDEVTFGWSGR